MTDPNLDLPDELAALDVVLIAMGSFALLIISAGIGAAYLVGVL